MTSISHGPALAPREQRSHWIEVLRVPELWASLAIATMWLAVLFDSVYGSDFVSTSGSGSSSTTIPSGAIVALFASLASAAVAKHAFGRERK